MIPARSLLFEIQKIKWYLVAKNKRNQRFASEQITGKYQQFQWLHVDWKLNWRID